MANFTYINSVQCSNRTCLRGAINRPGAIVQRAIVGVEGVYITSMVATYGPGCGTDAYNHCAARHWLALTPISLAVPNDYDRFTEELLPDLTSVLLDTCPYCYGTGVNPTYPGGIQAGMLAKLSNLLPFAIKQAQSEEDYARKVKYEAASSNLACFIAGRKRNWSLGYARFSDVYQLVFEIEVNMAKVERSIVSV